MTDKPVSRMPRPWFVANTRNTTMGYITEITSSARRLYPLQEGERELGWFVLPPFQRPPVWTQEQKVRFIESAWAGLPIGVFVVNRPNCDDGPYHNWLLDGQQRVTAVLDYAADGFKVGGYYFSELGIGDHRRWCMLLNFTCLETALTDEAQLRDVYDRLAYGGTPHEPKGAA